MHWRQPLPLALVAVALVAAGCLDGENGESTQPGVNGTSPTGGVPATGGAPGAPANTPPKPGGTTGEGPWAVGDEWNYTITDGSGAAQGYARYRVTGVGSHEGRAEYKVEILRAGADGEATTQTAWFDQLTLHERHDDCGQPGVKNDCAYTLKWLDLPLTAGKTWSTRVAGGDVVLLHRATAQPVGNVWNVTFVREECPDCGDARIELTYDPSIGFLRERTTYGPDGSVMERWTLKDALAA